MYELTVREGFSAAHRLPNTGGRCERLHGHDWRVEARVAAAELDGVGMVMDFHDVKRALRGVLDEMDHNYLNDLPAFRSVPPTAENLARHVYERLAAGLPPGRVRLTRVRVWESDATAASYGEPSGPKP